MQFLKRSIACTHLSASMTTHNWGHSYSGLTSKVYLTYVFECIYTSAPTLHMEECTLHDLAPEMSRVFLRRVHINHIVECAILGDAIKVNALTPVARDSAWKVTWKVVTFTSTSMITYPHPDFAIHFPPCACHIRVKVGCVYGVMCEVCTECEGRADCSRHCTSVGGVVHWGAVGGGGGDSEETWEDGKWRGREECRVEERKGGEERGEEGRA